MNRTYRKGAIGALTDEYEKAIHHMMLLVVKMKLLLNWKRQIGIRK